MSLISRARQRLIDGRPGHRPGRVVEFGKTMLVVVPLTALIWIYAERAQQDTEKVSLLVTAAATEPNLVANVLEPDREPLSIELAGSRGQIEEFKRAVEKTLDSGRYTLTLSGVDAAVGTRVIDATQLLNRDPLFADSGVTVTSTTPAQIRVNVEPLKSNVQATVKLKQDNLNVELRSYSFDPPTVLLSGPQSAFPPGEPTVLADPSGLTARDDAGAQTIDVALIPPNNGLKLSATKVKMTYTAPSSVQTVTVPTAFIDVSLPAGDANGKTKVVITSGNGNVYHNVQLRGPTNLVNKYTGASPSATLRLLLSVKHEDIGQPSVTRKLEWLRIEDGQVNVVGGPYEVTFEARED